MAIPAKIDDKAQYWVKLKTVVRRPNNVVLAPGASVRVSGRLLKEIKDAVDDAKPAG